MKKIKFKTLWGGGIVYKLINIVFLLTIIFLLFNNDSFAGTDGEELQTAYDKFLGIVSGVGGKIIALTSGVLGLVGCAVKFNPTAIMSFLGVSVGVGSLGFIVDSTVTCVLNF